MLHLLSPLLLSPLSIVKEEVTDDTAILPLYSGRIVSWVSKGRMTEAPLPTSPTQLMYS